MRLGKDWPGPRRPHRSYALFGVAGVIGVAAIVFLVLSLLGINVLGTSHEASEELVEPLEYIPGELVTDYSGIQYTLEGELGGYLTFGMVSDSNSRYAIEIGPDSEVNWAYEFHSNRDPEIPSDVRRLDNGNYLVVIEQNGFYEITREGEVVWYLLDQGSSLQAVPLDNGNLLTLNVPAGAREITRLGEVIWEWKPRDTIFPYSDGNYVGGWSEHSGGGLDLGNMYYQYREPSAGWTHLNTVQKLEGGHHLLCLRNFDLVVELDENNRVVWTYGALVLKHPHSPVRLDNGNTLIYDNGNGKVIEVTRDHRIVWEYSGLDSAIGGTCQRMPNGDTVITDTLKLRILSVTPNKDIVWDLVVRNISPGRPAIWRGIFYPIGD